jgi:hypothetical protein
MEGEDGISGDSAMALRFFGFAPAGPACAVSAHAIAANLRRLCWPGVGRMALAARAANRHQPPLTTANHRQPPLTDPNSLYAAKRRLDAVSAMPSGKRALMAACGACARLTTRRVSPTWRGDSGPYHAAAHL